MSGVTKDAGRLRRPKLPRRRLPTALSPLLLTASTGSLIETLHARVKVEGFVSQNALLRRSYTDGIVTNKRT
jgi:hypothetical protein